MEKQLTTKQFVELCDKFGRDSFTKAKVDIRPGRKPLKNAELAAMVKWLEEQCVNPFYITKENRSSTNYIRDIAFYFTDPQDKMIFTLCYGEIFT